ncbi:hypothetical protein EGJ03_09485 [Stenotrophomonas maltophilia]|nr:hypothetical protein EGJ06_03580 [Stenotrophomonas maltophilia]RRU13692.1 hypothetical protein EGJ77_03355 [Stenotrophomonas maltophilia]RRU32113.1 hypothetical protein EGJ03_09485 [Stenotrophomonas maltophilia]RRU99555.1 hypothetical protein EGI91_04435 [Stenotrophomonas maltophilia]
MPLKKIDISTDHGTWVGDLFPVAFTKANDNDEYLEQLAMNAATGAVQKTGDVMTGGLYWKFGTGRILRVINDGAGNAQFQATNNAGTAFSDMNLRGSNVFVVTDNVMRVDCLQMMVQGPTVPAGQYAGYILGQWVGRPGANSDRMELQYYRETNDGSTSWSAFNWRFGRTVDATAQQFIEFHREGRLVVYVNGQAFNFQSSGNATAPGSFINGGSDPEIKDKESLRRITNATDALAGLNIRIGKYKQEFNRDQNERAFVMADDAMRKHTPEVIIENVIDDKYAGWATDQLIAYLVAAHQEKLQREVAMQERIEAMGARIAVLEAAVEPLEPAP